MTEPESSNQKGAFGVESSQAGADTVDRAQRIGVALTQSTGLGKGDGLKRSTIFWLQGRSSDLGNQRNPSELLIANG